MSDLSVSIILPTFNRAHCLQRAVNSVRAQSHKNWELLIIDDGSTDETSTLIPLFNDPRIQYHKLNENKGVSAARNFGIKNSHFKWIALIDSDDEWLPDKLEKQINYLKQKPLVKFIHCDEIWIRNGVRVNPHKKHQKQGGRIYLQCLPLCCVSPSASFIHRDLFNNEGLFDENYPVCEDYDLWLRFFSKHEAAYVDEFLLKKYGGHDDQLSHKYFAMDYWRVKSLQSILSRSQHRLSEHEIIETKKEIQKKCSLLLKGYKKHNNLKHYEEVLNIFNLNQ